MGKENQKPLPKIAAEYLAHIVLTHNPNDRCQRIVRDNALSILLGDEELPAGYLWLTNGTRGYNMSIPFPEKRKHP